MFGFFSIILFIRIIGAENYGQYSLLISQSNLIVALGFGWVNQAQLRYYSKDISRIDYDSKQIISLVYSLIICIIVLTALVLIQSFSIWIWLISIVTIGSMGGFNYLKTIYQAKLQPKKVFFIVSFQACLSLLLPIIILIFFNKSEISLLFGIGLSFLIVQALIVLRHKVRLSKLFISWRENKKNNISIVKWLKYGIPMSIWLAAGLTLPFLDRYFINHFLPSVELGIYSSLQELLARMFSLTLFPLILALHPRIMNLWNNAMFQEASTLIKRGIILIFCIGITILFTFWQFSDIIYYSIKMIIPQFNVQYKNLIMPIICAGFLWQISLLTHKMMELNDKTLYMVFAILPSILINIIGNSIFIPIIGVEATAYTAFLSALVYFIITSIVFVVYSSKIKQN